jgi:hypothetical protein
LVRQQNKKRETIIKREAELEIFWQCEIEEMLKKNKEAKNFFDECHDTGALKFRDAFFGGRTNVEMMYSKANIGEEIKYMDIVSLYPYINYSTKYPVGQPKCTIYNKNVKWTTTEDVTTFESTEKTNLQGIIKCFVIPPTECELPPILPGRFGDERLLFTFCNTCAKKNKTGRKEPGYRCPHTDENKRGFVTTSTTPEICLALDNGYKVTRLFRAYSFDEWDDDLFKGYVREFLKLKIEASGWPLQCIDETSKEDFIRENYLIYGIQVDPAKMNKNPGLRYISKVNSN